MIQANGTYLTADGKPFFWLADTAWNGVLKATEEEWEEYLRTRAAQGFNVIQFVCTHWRAYDEEQAFSQNPLRMNEEFYAKRDRLVEMIHEHGLVPAPVLLWACTPEDPGQYLSGEDAIEVARYIVERWGTDPVVWMLGGDGPYQGERAERWHRIGRAVFDGDVKPLVTMHPCGQCWVTSEFRHEPWFGFHGYQSGHGDSDGELWWLLNGPPERPWEGEPVQPIINLEPNYEGHKSYATKLPFDAHAVRRAAYWSLLVTPTAGVTYGNNSIWWWGRKPEDPLAHEWLGPVAAWRDGLNLPGIGNHTTLKRFFESLPWWELRPAQQLLAEQPGKDEPKRFIAVAATGDGGTVVAYLPVGSEIRLQGLADGLTAQWFDPRMGHHIPAGDVQGDVTLTAPDGQDWVLLLQAK